MATSSGAIGRFDDKARESFEHAGPNHRLSWRVAAPSRLHARAPLDGRALFLPCALHRLQHLSPVALPLVHSHLRRRTTQPRHAPLVRRRLRLLLRIASPELAPAHDLDRSRFRLDAQHGEDRQRRRENGSARHRLLQRRTENSVLGDRRRQYRLPHYRHHHVGGRENFRKNSPSPSATSSTTSPRSSCSAESSSTSTRARSANPAPSRQWFAAR